MPTTTTTTTTFVAATAFAAAIAGAGLVTAGAAWADSADPGAPGRAPAPAVAPDLGPQPGLARPTTGAGLAPGGPGRIGGLGADGAQADARLDAALGVLPGADAADGGAKHYYVDEDGELACVTLDTFFPEPC